MEIPFPSAALRFDFCSGRPLMFALSVGERPFQPAIKIESETTASEKNIKKIIQLMGEMSFHSKWWLRSCKSMKRAPPAIN